jgi:hypothetical protein
MRRSRGGLDSGNAYGQGCYTTKKTTQLSFFLESHDTQQVSTRYHGRKKTYDEPNENTIAHQL